MVELYVWNCMFEVLNKSGWYEGYTLRITINFSMSLTQKHSIFFSKDRH